MQLRVREIREALGLTQADLAMRLGLSVNYYAQLERSSRPISSDHLEEIASHLNCAVTDLIDGGLPPEVGQITARVRLMDQDGLRKVLRYIDKIESGTI